MYACASSDDHRLVDFVWRWVVARICCPATKQASLSLRAVRVTPVFVFIHLIDVILSPSCFSPTYSADFEYRQAACHYSPRHKPGLIDDDHLDPIEPMKRMPPSTSPPVRVQPLALGRRRHPSDMIEYESAGDDHSRLLSILVIGVRFRVNVGV
jgi:hypothetical protein